MVILDFIVQPALHVAGDGKS